MRPTYTRASKATFICLAWLLCLVVMAGCATYRPVDNLYTNPQIRLQAQAPQGWQQFTSDRTAYVITRDGLRLEAISVRVVKMGKKLPGTERVYRSDMLPHEIAQLSLGLLESSDGAKNAKVEKVELAKVAGRNGYKAAAVYTDKEGLRKRLCLYGVVIGDSVCEFRYNAAEKAFYGKYLSAFEQMVASAKVE